MTEGRLIYVMGPSGAGKDRLIALAKEKVNKNNDIYFSHRYITRPAAVGEEHIVFTDDEFVRYQRIGMFALDWEAHGYCYGISVVIDNRLQAGKTVVVNGSRAYLPIALMRYPHMTAVSVTVAADVARSRLYARGRENTAEIEARMARAPALAATPSQMIVIDNSGPLENGVAALTRVLIGDGNQGFRRAHGSLAAL